MCLEKIFFKKSTVNLANSVSYLKVKIPQQAGLQNDKCVFHKQCQLDPVSFCEKHIYHSQYQVLTFFSGNLTWWNLKGLVELANSTKLAN